MNNINDTKPTVSVVMITYNHEAFIAEAIEGVLMQNADFPIELIIADDCSPDKTQEIVQGYIDTHPKGHWINYTRHSANKGMMPNFIWALNQAKGKYIALCEGDDYWTSVSKLKTQFKFLSENQSIVLSVHDTQEIRSSGDFVRQRSENLKLFKLEHKNQFIDIETILMKEAPFFHTSSFFFVNNLINYEVFINLHSGDIPLLFLIAEKGKLHYSSNCYSVYRHHLGGVTKSKSRKQNYHKKNREMYTELKNLMDESYSKPIHKLIIQDRIRESEYFLKFERGAKKIIHFIRLLLLKKRHNYSFRDLFYLLRH